MAINEKQRPCKVCNTLLHGDHPQTSPRVIARFHWKPGAATAVRRAKAAAIRAQNYALAHQTL